MNRAAIALALVIALGGGVVVRSAEAASLGDKPLPLLNGTERAKHLYSVTGVRHFGSLGTSFDCTSTEKTGGKEIVLGVEIINLDTVKNDVTQGEGVVTIPPGGTRVIATRGGGFFGHDEALDAVLGADTISRGSARILATSTKVICAAFIDASTSGIVTPLPVIKKTKQQGQ